MEICPEISDTSKYFFMNYPSYITSIGCWPRRDFPNTLLSLETSAGTTAYSLGAVHQFPFLQHVLTVIKFRLPVVKKIFVNNIRLYPVCIIFQTLSNQNSE